MKTSSWALLHKYNTLFVLVNYDIKEAYLAYNSKKSNFFYIILRKC